MSLVESAKRHDSMVSAADGQRLRLGAGSQPANRWDAAAARFTSDPRRVPEPNLRAVMEYVRPEHVLLDIGGGAGRYSLPMALRCREVINIEPSPGMGAAFEASAHEAKIDNARWVGADWLTAEGVTGDVAIVVHVTYFVPEIVPFIQKLNAACSERVVVGTCITPPPNQGANLYEVINGEPMALVPGYRELLAVLWDMGIVPDVRVLDSAEATSLGGVSASRGEAVEAAVRSARDPSAAAKAVESRFDDLFYAVEGGFRRRPSGDPRMMLITWQTGAVD